MQGLYAQGSTSMRCINLSSSIHGHKKAVECGTWVGLVWRALEEPLQGLLSSSLEQAARPAGVELGSPGSGGGEVSRLCIQKTEVTVCWLSPPLPAKVSPLPVGQVKWWPARKNL